MRHVDHKHGAAFIGDFSKAAEVYRTRIGRITGKQNKRLYFHRLFFDFVVIQKTAFFMYRIRKTFKHARRNILPVAVGQVPARIIVEP